MIKYLLMCLFLFGCINAQSNTINIQHIIFDSSMLLENTVSNTNNDMTQHIQNDAINDMAQHIQDDAINIIDFDYSLNDISTIDLNQLDAAHDMNETDICMDESLWICNNPGTRFHDQPCVYDEYPMGCFVAGDKTKYCWELTKELCINHDPFAIDYCDMLKCN